MKSTIPVIATAASAIVMTLSACNRADDGRTVGQRVDSAVASTERKAEEAHADLGRAGERLKDAASTTADAVVDKAKDAAITTSVNAVLAKDYQLNALRIDVDTAGGRVRLNGSAPDGAARERATRLATGVDGVRSVDNQLQVRP